MTTITRLNANGAVNGRVDTLTHFAGGSDATGLTLTLTRDTTTPAPGCTARARVTTSTAATGGTQNMYLIHGASGTNLCTPGVTYTAKAWTYGGFSGTDQVVIQWFNAADAVISSSTHTVTAVSPNIWYEITNTAVAPAGAVRARFIIVRTRAAGGGNIPSGSTFSTTGVRWRVSTPADVITPELLNGYEISRETLSTVHLLASQSTNRATLRPAGPRSGTLEILLTTAAAAAAAVDVLGSAAMFTLADPDVPQVDMDFVVPPGRIVSRLDPTTCKLWLVSFPVAEVLDA